eukprot:4215165-Amphidinium_carterae.1
MLKIPRKCPQKGKTTKNGKRPTLEVLFFFPNFGSHGIRLSSNDLREKFCGRRLTTVRNVA